MIHDVIVSPSSSSTPSSNHCIAILLPDGPLWHRSFLFFPSLPPSVFQFLLENDNSRLQAAYLQSSPTPRPLREASTGPRCPNASLYCYCTYKPSPTEAPQKNLQVCSVYVFAAAHQFLKGGQDASMLRSQYNWAVVPIGDQLLSPERFKKHFATYFNLPPSVPGSFNDPLLMEQATVNNST